MRRLITALCLPAVLAVGGCAGGSSAPPAANAPLTPAAPTAPKALHDWPQYHRTAGRSGHATSTITPPLHTTWSQHLDGAVYGEPIIAGGTLIAATENDSVYGLNPRNGHVRWRAHLGSPAAQSTLPCGDIDPLGITGTPAYDRSTGSVFVVAETTGGHHTLWALKAATGSRRWHRSLDVLSDRNIKAEQQRSALLVTGHRVITAFGGLAGDCDNYVGYVTSVATSGHGKTTHYAVPTSREAGIWSPAGPVTGGNGNVYVATGNGAETGGKWDKSDSVTELVPKSMRRVAIFAPSTWPQDNQQDLDLGSSSPVQVNHRIVIAGKRGTVYLLRNALGGVGNQLATLSGCAAFGGAARFGHTAVMPCSGGLRALLVGKHSLHWRWQASGVFGSPTVAGHRVLVPDRDSGDVLVLSRRSGHVQSRIHVGSFTHFPSVAVGAGQVFVPTLDGVTALHQS